MEPSRQAALVTLEVVGLAVVAIAPLPVPAAAALLVLATISLAVRGLGFAGRFGGWQPASVGALVGMAAALVAVAVAAPVLESLGGAVVWAQVPIVRGNASAFVFVALIAALVAAAGELALRGWLLPRAEGLLGGRALAVALVFAVEVALAAGPAPSRVGVAVAGLGASLLYLGGGGRLGPPIAAQATFAVALVAVEALRWR